MREILFAQDDNECVVATCIDDEGRELRRYVLARMYWSMDSYAQLCDAAECFISPPVPVALVEDVFNKRNARMHS